MGKETEERVDIALRSKVPLAYTTIPSAPALILLTCEYPRLKLPRVSLQLVSMPVDTPEEIPAYRINTPCQAIYPATKNLGMRLNKPPCT